MAINKTGNEFDLVLNNSSFYMQHLIGRMEERDIHNGQIPEHPDSSIWMTVVVCDSFPAWQHGLDDLLMVGNMSPRLIYAD